MFVLIPTSLGNVAGRKDFLFFTLIVTLAMTYVPFSTLIWYDKGTPHNVTYSHEYEVICPAWISREEAAPFNDPSEDFTQNYLTLDSSCTPIVEWCQNHPEMQGKVRHHLQFVAPCFVVLLWFLRSCDWDIIAS